MNEQIISPETARLAVEKGFSLETCRCGGFPDCICADKKPTQALLQKWLREEHALEILVYCNASGWLWEINKAFSLKWFSGGTHIKWSEYRGPNDSGEWNTHEEALENGLIETLNLIK